MAEALLRTRFSDRYEAASAGTAPSEVHPLAIQVLEEIGVSPLGLRSKSIEELSGRKFDIVVTVCGQDEPSCPFFPGGRPLHRTFDDPNIAAGSDAMRLAAFRRTRDEIDAWIREIFGRKSETPERKPAWPWRQPALDALLEGALATVDVALEEDAAREDPTSRAVFFPKAKRIGTLRAKAPGVVAGLPLAAAVFRRLDEAVEFEPHVDDGEEVAAGDSLATVRGTALAVLGGERIALNYLQRLSGIATLTRRFVDAVATTPARILDTRKTAPGLRAADKYAVRMGGGMNHRSSLADLAMVKENHIDAAGGLAAGGLVAAVHAVREHASMIPVEVEVRSLEELDDALRLVPLPDAILLDNFAVAALREAVQRIGGRTWVEASGGVTLSTAGEIARTGVDTISVGALTHSVPALDISLDIELPAPSSSHSLADDVRVLKEALGARMAVLGHPYLRDDVLAFADVRGDSLRLAQAAAESPAEHLVVCGVRFMGETAAVLASPSQSVYLPAPSAGCFLADCATHGAIDAAWRHLAAFGSVAPLVYVNSSLGFKAFCGERGGATCTSANAAGMLRWALARAERVLFLPDRNLALCAARTVGLTDDRILEWNHDVVPSPERVRSARLIVWPGACNVHRRFTLRHVEDVRRRMPTASIAVHPECDLDVVRAADRVGSTGQIVDWVQDAAPGSRWAIGTEHRLVHRLAAQHPEQTIVGLSDVPSFCSTMAEVRLVDLRNTLRAVASGDFSSRLRLPAELVEPARLAVRRMLEAGRNDAAPAN